MNLNKSKEGNKEGFRRRKGKVRLYYYVKNK